MPRRIEAASQLGRLVPVDRALGRDLVITWRSGGLPEIREALVARTLHRLWRRQTGTLYEQQLVAREEPPPPAGVEIRSLIDRDWELLARFLTTRAMRRIRDNAIPGNTCLIAWRGERPVGFTWISEPGVEPGSLPVPIPSDAVYGWDLWVDPGERRRGVGSALVNARLAYGRRRGYRRALRVIYDDNRPALGMLDKISDPPPRPVGRVTYRTAFGRRRMRYEPGPDPVAADPVASGGLRAD